jgi:hypothetical protein
MFAGRVGFNLALNKSEYNPEIEVIMRWTNARPCGNGNAEGLSGRTDIATDARRFAFAVRSDLRRQNEPLRPKKVIEKKSRNDDSKRRLEPWTENRAALQPYLTLRSQFNFVIQLAYPEWVDCIKAICETSEKSKVPEESL